MTDREKVIKGLETCLDVCSGGDGDCSGCPYSQTNGDRCLAVLVHDAIDLLKEQEPMQVLSQRECEMLPNHYERKGFCPKCHQEMEWLFNRQYCGFCGQAVKWK